MKTFIVPWLICLWWLGWSMPAAAHKQSDSYLSISQPTEGVDLNVQWDIALRDLEHAIGLDSNADAAITWGELRQRQSAVVGYASSHLQVSAATGDPASDCPLHFVQMLVDEHVDGRYAVLRFNASCARRPQAIEVRYSLLFDVDQNHHGLLNVSSPGGSHAAVLAEDSGAQRFSLNTTQPAAQLTAFVMEGIWHIWAGYDHILFLLTLLLPAVVRYRAGQWQPRDSLHESLLDIVKVVTAFTLAHSITLALGALGWVYVPSRIVESAIALTVLFGAANILLPVVRERRWLLAFIFGLVHGLAFASVLTDLGLQDWNLLLALLGFNGGVEIGQLAIVTVIIPTMYFSRRTFMYRRLVLPAGATAIACMATYWFVQRAFI